MTKKLKTLKEYNQDKLFDYSSTVDPSLNGIECPICGEELRDSRPMVSLTSWPPKKEVNCNSCGYTGYRIA